MTPEHNPPKDPSLAETTVLPRFPPAGWRRCAHGEYRAKGDLLTSLGATDISLADPVSETVGRMVTDSDFLITLAPIAPAPQAPDVEQDAGVCYYRPTGWVHHPRKEWATDCGLKVTHDSEAFDGTDWRTVGHGNECMKCKRKPQDAPQATEPKAPVLGDATALAALDARELILGAFEEGVRFGIEEGIRMSRSHNGIPKEPTPVSEMWDGSDSKESVASLVSIIQPDGGKA